MTAQTIFKPAGDLTASDIGKGIWCRIRYKPQEEWPDDASNHDGRMQWGWARIVMVTHTSRGSTKVRIRGGGLVDWTYPKDETVNITKAEFTR